MMLLIPNPLPGQEFSKDSMNYNNLMDWNVGPGLEDPSRKVRKPYTITKSRESWSEQEHDKFLEALQLFDRDWKKIEAFVGSKTVIQIRSHAQKYFLKVQKNGTSEHVPPPRPKRKAAHPYPQKAPKIGIGPLQSSAAVVESVRHDSMTVPQNQINSTPLSPWTYNVAPTISVSCISKAGVSVMHNYSSSSNECAPPLLWTSNEANRQVKDKCREGVRDADMPDFAQVYRFIGSVFDPSAGDHLQQLKRMDPINIETAVMLMKNLSVNLVSPEFENHRRLLSSHNIAIEKESTISAV